MLYSNLYIYLSENQVITPFLKGGLPCLTELPYRRIRVFFVYILIDSVPKRYINIWYDIDYI